MKINRVIRFQQDSVKETTKQEEPRKTKKDASPNKDILVEEYNEEKESNVQETFSYNASNELIRCVQRVASERTPTNMIGVFGVNSDIVINNLCRNLSGMRQNIIFVGKVNFALSDVYNSIAAIFFNYIKNNYDRQYDMNYYFREVLMTLEKVYDSPNDYYGELSPLESLSYINRIYERDKNLLSAINRIKQIINSSSYSENRDLKFLVNIETDKFDYKTLNSLARLNSSDLIIIVSSMFNFDFARMSLRNSFDVKLDCMDKFFYPGNCVMAGADSI